MDKITHQICAEHWTRTLNECMNGGMSKTTWCRANGICEKQFFYWQRILHREAYEASQDPPLPVVAVTESLSAVLRTVSFAEIKLPAVSPDASPLFRPDLVIWKGDLVLEISNSASSELLSRVVIIPEHFEPLNRILRATIPENESQSKSMILSSTDYLLKQCL